MKKIFSALLLLAAIVLSGAVQARTINGDLNHTGDLDVEDITLLINGYLTGDKEYVNGGNSGHEYVDLGLSVMWATMNVGAKAPEDYGDYFAWGETVPKTDYGWSTYKWCNGSENTLTKYCTDSDYGTVDDMIFLYYKDDAANMNWGSSWRMPAVFEIEELINNCSWEWTTLNGVNGQKVTGPNGNSIFLPAAGLRWGDNLNYAGNYGQYWSSTLGSNIDGHASNLVIDSDGVRSLGYYRFAGLSVRAVWPYKALTINGDLNHNGDLDVDDITLLINNYLTGNKEYFIDGGGSNNGYEYVDLGLSVNWATMNVGANASEEYGDYFAWGETEPKDIYNWSTYKWCNGSQRTQTKYCTALRFGTVDNKTVLELADDAAQANWGGTWRMPTKEEIDDLVYLCSWEWTTQNGVSGQKVTGPSGNFIFLPAAGGRLDGSLDSAGDNGFYWLNSLRPTRDTDAYDLNFNSGGPDSFDHNNRCRGYSVRAVCP